MRFGKLILFFKFHFNCFCTIFKSELNVTGFNQSLLERTFTAIETDSYFFELKTRCLESGNYYKRLEFWLNTFGHSNIFLIDSEKFINEPYEYLFKLQTIFEVDNVFDFKKNLVLNDQLSFFCLKKSIDEECLERVIEKKQNFEFDDSFDEILQKYFSGTKKNLKNLLHQYNYEVPEWLANK